ncbi:unnamed protein product [Nezara viridula]|uniref:Coiled-coil domain-containing protein R3HCC1L n=1 Tax=Nezara viridula TaxID=85310 RepID=A0A9P0E5A8_NEZVI|nr:unnamed protein product [Nezara viridula]
MEADNKLMKKNKKVASNFYIPPPARKSENCPQMVLNETKSKDRSAEKLKNVNENMKICNNSSLLFKSDETDSHHVHNLQTSVKKKRKRKKKGNLKKDCESQNIHDQNFSVEIPIVSAETLENADCQSVNEIGPFSDISRSASISVLSFKNNGELSANFSAVECNESISVKSDNNKHPLNDTGFKHSNGTVDDRFDVPSIDSTLEYSDNYFINDCLTKYLNINEIKKDSIDVTENAGEIHEDLKHDFMTSEKKPVSSTILYKTSNSSPDESRTESSQLLCKDDANDDWEKLLEEDELHNLVMKTEVSGSITIMKKAHVYEDEENIEEKYSNDSSIIEIYGFPEEFKTQDLYATFSPYVNRGFQLKWVDNNHALGIFPSPIIADEVLSSGLPFVKIRSLNQATPQSKEKAKNLILPSSSRPKTCSALARRLVSGALGLRAVFTQAEIQREKQMLKEAREQKRLAAKQRDAAWEGKF